jgi:hypothetical protein
MKTRTLATLAATALCLLALPLAAHADDRHGGGPGGGQGAGDRGGDRSSHRGFEGGGRSDRGVRPPGRDFTLDRRFDHDRYYPRPGAQFQRPPPGGFYRPWRGDRYYFHGGVWYRPWGPRYLVVRPPFGIGIDILPPFYTTVWFGGIPYYYADDSYYVWEPARREYVVTAPPAGSDAAATRVPAETDFYAYPKNGQSESQQANDRYECHDWARTQSGYDPTQPPAGDTGTQRAEYRRAERACLEGRGYSVN